MEQQQGLEDMLKGKQEERITKLHYHNLHQWTKQIQTYSLKNCNIMYDIEQEKHWPRDYT